MNIDVKQNNNVAMRGKNLSGWTKRIKQAILNKTPNITTKKNINPEKLNQFDDIISRPDVNRAIMGVTALATQPAIDYYNHRVDDETREVAKNRTIAKIVAGTGVGVFLVRGPLYKLIKKTTDVNGKSKYSQSLIPKKYFKELTKDAKALGNYRSALSMTLSLFVMIFTNFLLDAPLTIYFTNKLNERSAKLGKITPKEEGKNE